MVKTTWMDIRTGKARCEKCAVWEWFSEYWEWKQRGGIIRGVAYGKECVLINLAAAKVCLEAQDHTCTELHSSSKFSHFQANNFCFYLRFSP